ncbi:patatin-like phospholipase family protein [Luteimonas sp. MC1828]|uniref:patatin-like phospholipase family protein n=1 Tax=Luteimonas sp. MC1828 TaxID=2799787 RepID=UPI0018F1FF54|nr:patatin-like phospholipase family protein [Luteimonas sp. MC1828]
MSEASPAPSLRARPRVAVVVGSGGVKCAAAVGMWKVLEREGIRADMVVGCSGGSIYMAGMALGRTAAEAEHYSHEMWSGLFRRLHVRSVLRSLLPRRFGFSERIGLVDDAAVCANIARLFGAATFADAGIPLHIAATDLHSGEKVALSSGSIAEAVRASIAMPLLLRPWPVDGRLLVDGGVSDPLPISLAIREGAEIILAMGFARPPLPRIDSLLGIANQAISVTINNLLHSTYAFYSAVHHAEIVPIMPAFDAPIEVGDSHLIPYIIEQGEQAALAALPYLRQLGLCHAAAVAS